KKQIVFVKDTNGNGLADAGDQVWVRAAEVSSDTQQRGRQEVGHQETGVLNATTGVVTVTDNASDAPIFLTAGGKRTLTDTGIQSITVVNTGEAIQPGGRNVLIYLTLDTGKRTTTVTSRQSILVTNLLSDPLLYLTPLRDPTTVAAGNVAFIAGGILVEDRIQERGVQEVGFQETGRQERGFQERGFQSRGRLDEFGNIVVDNVTGDRLLFKKANNDLTFDDTGIQHITVSTNTTDAGIQSIEITNSASAAKLWIDPNGNLTTAAGNAPVVLANGTQSRGIHKRDSAQHLLYRTENNVLTTAGTNIPEIEVTNNPRDDLLYKNAQNHNTTDAGNKMAIASADRASKLFNPNNLATVSIWVEDDNDKTTAKTG